jgi:hypothetical protein
MLRFLKNEPDGHLHLSDQIDELSETLYDLSETPFDLSKFKKPVNKSTRKHCVAMNNNVLEIIIHFYILKT